MFWFACVGIVTFPVGCLARGDGEEKLIACLAGDLYSGESPRVGGRHARLVRDYPPHVQHLIESAAVSLVVQGDKGWPIRRAEP